MTPDWNVPLSKEKEYMWIFLALATLLICLGEEHLENNSNYWKQIRKIDYSLIKIHFSSSLGQNWGTWPDQESLYLAPLDVCTGRGRGQILRHWGCLLQALCAFHLSGTQRRWDENPSSYRAVKSQNMTQSLVMSKNGRHCSVVAGLFWGKQISVFSRQWLLQHLFFF